MFTIKKSIGLLSSLLLGSLAANSLAAESVNHSLAVDSAVSADDQKQGRLASQQKMDFSQHKRNTALNIAQQYQQLRPLLASEITVENRSVSLQTLKQSGNKLDLTEFNHFETAVINAKGYSAKTADLVELRLADKSMFYSLQNGISPLFAFEPAGDESQWQYIEAFDADGNTHLLDVHKLPSRPVIVVDINAKSDLKAGLAQMRSVFAAYQNGAVKNGEMKAKPGTSPSSAIAIENGGEAEVLETSVLKKISLKNDEEPWISGDAEIYGIVNGVDASRDEPILDVVDMPYLDDEDTTYSPNQIVIFWARYRWSAADMILMEHDDNTNYKDLAIALAEAAGAIMAVIPDPTTQGLAVLGQITAGLIKAMPDDWFINDDDFVDVFYTILKDSSYSNYYGAGANAKISLEPLTIN